MKYLTEEELIQFINWCKTHKIKQKEIANITGLHEQWISKVFSARKDKRNKNFKGDVKAIKKYPLERAHVKLVVMTKKEDALRDIEFNL